VFRTVQGAQIAEVTQDQEDLVTTDRVAPFTAVLEDLVTPVREAPVIQGQVEQGGAARMLALGKWGFLGRT